MTVELRPLGVKCNIQCQYCYQNPQRDAGNFLHEYDLKVMMDAIEAEGGPFALFGGEPLLMPLPDLEKLWDWGLKRFAENSIQTNGVLITDEHIRLFEKYQVRVGISLDGPAELNDARWVGSLERTRDTTAGIESTIRKLCERGMPPTMIITLHRGNATGDKLPRMHAWFHELEALGVRSARLHLLEVDHSAVRDAYALSSDENRAAVRSFAELQSNLKTLKLDLFDDLRRMLAGDDDGVTCVWGACDPYTTSAVSGVEGNGQRSNCGRTNKDGIDFTKADEEGFERYVALYHTPQEHGGCNGCRFFLFCKGQCPGTGLENDWRNRSEHCEVWKESYARVESDLVAAGGRPLSLDPDLPRLEQFFLSAWESGHNTSLAHARASLGQFDTPTQTRTFEPEPGSPRLGFELYPFTRVAWTSDKARTVWAGRLELLRTVTAELEWRSVVAGFRPCAIVADADLPADLETHGLERVPLSAGRVLIGRPEAVAAFQAAQAARDAVAIADALGTPACCAAALQTLWVDEDLRDPTWNAATATSGSMREGDTVAADGHPLVHGLWRWLGIRPVAHLACRFDCVPTRQLAERVVGLGRQLGYDEDMDWLEEIHAWPIEWSSLHGIAEVRTPVVKISTQTDALATRRVARFRGTGRYPAEAAKGVRFPYIEPPKPLLTLSAGYRRGLANASNNAVRTSPVDPIHRDTLEVLTRLGRLDGRTVAQVSVTPYFTVVRLDDGSVGAAMSYFSPDEAAAVAPRLPDSPMSAAAWRDWLFENSERTARLGLAPDRANLVARSLRTSFLSALSAPFFATDGEADGYTVGVRPNPDPFATARRAVVIGFGGYIDRLAKAAHIEHLHICDLGYPARQVEMDAFAATSEPGRITISDGSDVAERIAACDAIAITGSALANGTMERLLEQSRGGGRAVVVQGQTAGLHPAGLFRHGATMVVTTRKPPELALAAANDPTGQSLRTFLEGGLPWVYMQPIAST
jgi:uncharacterized protein